MGRRDERGVLQLGPVDVRDHAESPEVQRPGEAEHLRARDAELGHEQLEDVAVHRLLDLEPHRRPEATPQELLLERGEEVLGVVLLDLEVLVPGDPEGVDGEHLHAGEQ